MKPILTLVVFCVSAFRLPAQVSFTLSSSPGVGSNPQAVVAADVNGDGKVDLISADSGVNKLSVLTNNGSGGFVLASSPGVGNGNTPVSAAAADVNGDGKADLISANYYGDSLSVLTNNGTGLFTSPTNFYPDIYPVGKYPRQVTTADVNGDGKIDLISGNEGVDTISVLTNNGSGGFVLATNLSGQRGAGPVTTADVNGDGKADIICANFVANTLSIFTNDGSGGFVLASTPGIGSACRSVAAADVNGDGKADLISANYDDNTLSVLTNNGSGGFSLAATIGVGNAPAAILATNVSGNGRVDLICANHGDDTLSVLTNTGGGHFVLATNLGVGSGPWAVTAVDVNGDGKLDLACANVGGNTLSVLTNSTPFQPIITTQPSNQIVTVGSNAFFSVKVAGLAPLSYQWRFGLQNIDGATNASLTLTNVQSGQAGNYAVLVTNAYGSALSSNATLTITPHHFTWSPIPLPQYLNTPFAVGIQARDATNGIFTNFTSFVSLTATNGLPVNPVVSGGFIQGVWTGSVVIAQTASNLVLRASDGLGHYGLANPINVFGPPNLSILHSGNIAIFVWPVGYTGFVLETSSGLAPATWVVVPYSPIQIGNQYLLPLDMNGTSGFYRLWFQGP